MSLRKQLAMAAIVIALAYGASVFLLTRSVLIGSLRRIEENNARQNLVRVRNAIEQELTNLDATARDYAYWDRTYEFMTRRDKKYVESELQSESLRNLRVTAVVILNEQGELLFLKNAEQDATRSLCAEDLRSLISPVAALLKPPSDAALNGIDETSSGPYLYAIRPILPTNLKGPSRGWLIMTRAFDDVAIDRVSRTINLRLVRVPATSSEFRYNSRDPGHSSLGDDIWVETSDAGPLIGYVGLEGADGKTTTVLKTEIEQVMRAEGKRAQWLLLLSLMAVALVAGLAAVLWLERVVLTPIARLSATIKQVTDNQDLSRRVPLLHGRRNQLASLMLRVNLMLDRLQRSHDELVTARATLEHEASHDGLTGALNQAAIKRVFENEIARGARENSPVAVLMIDVDHFKTVNDTYGHETGDEVLKCVVREIRGVLRPYDALGRYGGEEFLVIAPNCDRLNASHIAERIRRRIAEVPAVAAGHMVRVTVSIGAAVGFGTVNAFQDLCRAADHAMYNAKRNGRNRVSVAEETRELPQLTPMGGVQ